MKIVKKERSNLKKRCLIVGDYSSFGKNLKCSLEKKEIDVTIISDGDGWKNIKYSEQDISINIKNISIFKIPIRGSSRIKYYLYDRLKIQNELLKYKYDYILIMNQEFISKVVPSLVNGSVYLNLEFLKKIMNKSSKIYVLACGDDSYYLKMNKIYKYFPYKEEEIKNSKYFSKTSQKEYDKILEEITGIIPVMYDYAEAYRKFYKNKTKIKKTIPLTIDIDDIKFNNNFLNDKIVIFHGLNREEFKGTEYIKKAMENIKKKYPDRVEIIIDGKMPLEEYKKVIAKTNILVDQCRSYGYGMNALYGMAMGKLVFSGNEPENEKEFGEENIPVVNITPNVDDIEKKLEYYILNPELIISEGKRAREFVKRFHDSEVVARQYLKLFEEDSKINEN